MNWVSIFNGSVPIAVYTAIAIFLIKEGLEYQRRRTGDKRKLAVFKKELIRDCQRNVWFVTVATYLVAQIEAAVEPHSVRKEPNGDISVVISYAGGAKSSMKLPKAFSATYERLAVDVGYIDTKLAAVISKAHDAALDMDFVRGSIINSDQKPVEFGEIDFSMVNWGNLMDRIRVAADAFAELHKVCGGGETMVMRMH